MNRPAHQWPEAWEAELRRLHAEEKTNSQTATALNAKFGCKLTRNSVLGKKYRLGLCTPIEQFAAGFHAPQHIAVVVKPATRPAASSLRFGEHRPLIRSAPVSVVRTVETDPQFWTPFTDRSRFQCSYIMDGEGADAICCGHPVHLAGYCTAHHQLTRVPLSAEAVRKNAKGAVQAANRERKMVEISDARVPDLWEVFS